MDYPGSIPPDCMHAPEFDADGWYAPACRIPSPNHDARPHGAAIELIVLHNISLPPGVFSGDAVIDLFTNRLDCEAHPYYRALRGLEISAHFFIRRDGSLIQFVPCGRRAWHAGASRWQGRERCNDFSLGIELEGSDDTPFSVPQYATLETLVSALERHYPIRALAGHSDIAPGRKTDPGACFDWSRLRTAERILHAIEFPLSSVPHRPVMRLGTPLSPSATRVLLLGAGELGKEIVIALQRLGAEVIAADRYANAPGQQVAHRAHVLDMSDAAALRRLVDAEKPHLIVPEIEAIATEELLAIEAAGIATVIPTARAANLTMNREGIRRLAAETLGLPTSPYAFAGSLDAMATAAQQLGFPVIVKPVMSSSGKGQSRADDVSQLGAAWDYAAAGGRVDKGRVIVEGVIDFDYEITLLTVRAKNMAGEVETHFCEPIGHLQVKGDYVESWQPQPMSSVARARAQEIAAAVTGELGGLGLFGVELFVRGDSVWFSEVSPRPHDTGMVTMATQRQNEFELHARAILGLPVDTGLREAGASAVIYGGVEAAGIAFEGVAAALAAPGVELRLFGKPESFPRRRMGVALAVGATVEEARARAGTAASTVKPVVP